MSAADIPESDIPESSTAAEPGRRARKRSQTLDHLAATAFELFETYGYDAVTMEQIAAAADVAKGTLYNHYPVKEALLAHQFHQELAESAATLRDAVARRRGFVAKLSAFLGASAQWCDARRDYLGPYLKYRFASGDLAARARDDAERSGIDRLFDALIAAGQTSGELRDDYPSSHLAALFQHLYLGAMIRWLSDPSLSLDDEFGAIVDLFVRGAARAPRKKVSR